MNFEQISLFNDSEVKNIRNVQAKCPKTRYQGSKYKLLSWLRENLDLIEFDTALDAFGGTASVSYLMKSMGKKVIYNDMLLFNKYVGKALIENDSEVLTEDDINFIFSVHNDVEYTGFIESHFSEIYYTDEENRCLDLVTPNILSMKNEYKKAMAFWALFQACISKRPYNLFHRKNLYVRTSNVKRSFGNKVTWDKSFELHFRKFVSEINEAVFCNDKSNSAVCFDANELDVEADLVYIDPPYIPQKGTLTLYRDFYHFLEGLVRYYDWKSLIDLNSKHKKLKSLQSRWEDKSKILDAFCDLFQLFANSTLVISYREDGIPSVTDLCGSLQALGWSTKICTVDYKYALSKKKNCKEVLIVATK